MVKYVDRGILLRNDIIAEKLADIEGNVNLIKENIPENIEEFVWLDLVKDGIYRRLGFAIERLVNHPRLKSWACLVRDKGNRLIRRY